MPKIRGNIIDAEWSDCLSRLRDARALVLRDAESFHEAAMALERIGQVLCGQMRNGLAAYENELLELAKAEVGPESEECSRLFETVREARNMAVHEGAWARHLSSRLVDFILILEQTIMAKMKCAEDIMVRHPVVAETWHFIAHVRQTMLVNSFSSLPVYINDCWHIVNDHIVVRFLRGAENSMERKNRLSTPIGPLIQEGKVIPLKATCVSPKTKLQDLNFGPDKSLILIVECESSPPRLVGILSPFDLL